MLSVASGAYLRIPFNVDDPSILESDPGNDDAGGLVAYWDFEDGPGSSVLRDRSGNGWHGTLVNMDPATDWIAGRVGATALEFDGVNDFVSTLALANDLGIDGNAAHNCGVGKGPPEFAGAIRRRLRDRKWPGRVLLPHCKSKWNYVGASTKQLRSLADFVPIA